MVHSTELVHQTSLENPHLRGGPLAHGCSRLAVAHRLDSASLVSMLPLRKSQAKTLADLIAVAVQVGRISLAALGRHMTGTARCKHKIKRAWRFCANPRLGRITTASDGACRRCLCFSTRCVVGDGWAVGTAAHGWIGPRKFGVCWGRTTRRRRKSDWCAIMGTRTIWHRWTRRSRLRRRTSWRVAWRSTPRRGTAVGWLNVAAIELSVLARQCLDGRLGSPEELQTELGAWGVDRNAEGSQW
jgi:hypothetical protein